ncbi:autoinducer binding domain-containing protein [Yoonia sp. MH D7]
MSSQVEIRHILAALKETATGGFALAFHVRFTTPTFLFQTYPKDWLDYYSQKGLVMSDPTVAWGFENSGVISWADLRAEDTGAVLEKAAEFGLVYGATCAMQSDDSRSIGSFARADRDFTPQERDMLNDKLQILHRATASIKELSPETATALRTMSVQFTHT